MQATKGADISEASSALHSKVWFYVLLQGHRQDMRRTAYVADNYV